MSAGDRGLHPGPEFSYPGSYRGEPVQSGTDGLLGSQDLLDLVPDHLEIRRGIIDLWGRVIMLPATTNRHRAPQASGG
jgi:hypothetical protein